MANYEHKIGAGSLFPSDQKTKETDRDYNGDCKLECPHCNGISLHWISGWVNETRAGVEFLGLRFNPKEDQPLSEQRRTVSKGTLRRAGMATAAPQAGVPASDLDDDTPF